jgi:hypothetical protein
VHAIGTVHAEPRASVESPTFRVNFWEREPPEQAWGLDAYVLTEVGDVTEVLQWVHEHAGGRRFEVFAEIDRESVGRFESPRTTTLVRLLGSDPNAGEPIEIGRFEKV